jgi:hypothetical protein
MKPMNLTVIEVIKRRYEYDPETGLIYTRKPKSNKKRIVGFKDQDGYLRVNFWYEGKLINRLTHRIAFVLMTGDWPNKKEVDHINGIKTDNRWHNLRAVTTSENQCNQKKHRNGRVPGITLDAGVWRVWTTLTSHPHLKPKTYVGRFRSHEDAVEALRNFKK